MASLETLKVLGGIDHDSLYLQAHRSVKNAVEFKTTREVTITEELSVKDLQQLTHLFRQCYT